MCNKSLPTVSCDTIGLCGISVRFQTLSPTQGQVAHALLTRPPLIRDRSPFTVRLECVMHAASVNPEPGSNSRNHGILTPIKGDKINSELDLLFLLFLELYFSFRIHEMFFAHTTHFFSVSFASYLSLTVQFSRTVSPPPFHGDLIIISHSAARVKGFLKLF